jgi:hypothetical protein
VRAPACLDELVDWAHSASKMINDLKDGDEIIFLPYIKTSTVQAEYRKRDTVSQKHLLDFPQKSAFELSVFYEANVSCSIYSTSVFSRSCGLTFQV